MANAETVAAVQAVRARGNGVGFEVQGINKLRQALLKLEEGAREDFKQAGFQAATIVVDEAKRLVPYRTGALAESIRAGKVVSGAKVYAGKARVPYAGPIHFGWANRNIAPNPFLYEAADRRVSEVMDAYLAQVYEIWNRNV
jgi:hypothetical protein